MRESHRILQGNTGNRWNMEAVFRPGTVRIFSSRFLPTSCAFRQELVENYRKKISDRNTASTKSPELPGTGCFQAGLFDLGCLN